MNSVLLTHGIAVALAAAPQSEPDAAFWRAHLGDPQAMLQAYFAKEVGELADASKLPPLDAAGWPPQRVQWRQEFRVMLGLEPLPPRTDLRATVSGTIRAEQLGITIDKVHFQSSPGLYVTANLYRPSGHHAPRSLPAILYLCGHGRVVRDGRSYGNKTHYLHHPTWFARNGFACLIVDTLQLGEIQGLHHGTYRLNQWWWVRRGYTPAGVEAWNASRALDYLCSLPEIDPQRIGVTGRSGGGVGTWYLAAIDDRPAALVPVAGLTDLHDHVLAGCIDGHCDCNFFLNYHRWDYYRIAALAAPRPLLLANSDRDRIFPLAGVLRLHGELQRAYEQLGAAARLGLAIAPGPHQDTSELRVAAFRWMMRHLRGDQDAVIEPARKHFRVEQLRVFDELPAGARNRQIQESFVAMAPRRSGDLGAWHRRVMAGLRATTFRPARTPQAVRFEPVREQAADGVRRTDGVLHTGDAFRLPLQVWRGPASARPTTLVVHVGPHRPTGEELRRVRAGQWAVAMVVPRGLGPTAWPGDARRQNQVRRRFLVLGRTLDLTRIHDARAALHALRGRPELAGCRHLELRGADRMAETALFAAVLEPSVDAVRLTGLAEDRADRLALPGLNRLVHDADLIALAHPRPVHLEASDRQKNPAPSAPARKLRR